MTLYNNLTDEQVLWSEVLRQAKDDLDHDDEVIQEKARVWFLQDEADTLRYSFQICDIPGCHPETGRFPWVCRALGLDPGAVRESVLCN